MLKSNFTPWEHQVSLSDHAVKTKKSLWIADCGVGKSRAALMAINASKARISLILTVRAALRGVWPQEIEETLDIPYLVLDKGSSARKNADMIEWAAKHKRGIVVVNYETARLLSLDAVNWDLAVADESHRLKSPTSKQSMVLARLCKDIPIKIAMTGTAFSDKPLDVYGQARWLDVSRKGSYYYSSWFGSWTTFFENYCIYYQKDNIRIPQGYKNLDKMAEVLSPYVVEVKMEDVHDLPEISHIIKSVELQRRHREAYNDLHDNLIAYATNTDGEQHLVLAQNVLTVSLRLSQMTGGFYRPFDTRLDTQPIQQGWSKVRMLMDILDEIGGKPVVIFTRFRDDIDSIKANLKDAKITYRELTGDKDEHQEWKDGQAQVLIANIQAGGTGINLTRANYMIYYSMGYSRSDYEQSLARLHRPGQIKPVIAYYILAKDTIDEIIYASIKSKGDMSELLKEKIYEAVNG